MFSFLLPTMQQRQEGCYCDCPLASLTIEAFQEHETRVEEHGAECREQLGAPSSWLAGGPAQPSQPTCFCQTQRSAWPILNIPSRACPVCVSPIIDSSCALASRYVCFDALSKTKYRTCKLRIQSLDLATIEYD
jgi:hypothetical protein